MFTKIESGINDEEAITLNYKIKIGTRTFDSNSGDSLWQYLCILTFQKIEVSKLTHLIAYNGQNKENTNGKRKEESKH